MNKNSENQRELSCSSFDGPTTAASELAASEPARTPDAPSQGEETAAFAAGETVKTRPAAAGNGRTFGRYEVRGVLGRKPCARRGGSDLRTPPRRRQ